MARLSVEDEWWTDPRRMRLISLIGENRADGHAVIAWKISQQYWFKGELIPEHAWVGSGLGEELFICGLAEKRPDGIYVRGAERHFAWYSKHTQALQAEKADKREAGRIGGRVSAQRLRDERGRLLSKQNSEKANDSMAPAQAEPKHTQAPKQDPSTLQASSFSFLEEVRKETGVPVSSPLPQKRQSGSPRQTYPMTEPQQINALPSSSRIRWRELYGDEYLKREALKGLTWLEANPNKNRKTERGWIQFWSGWFDRGWDKSTTRGPSARAGDAAGEWETKAMLLDQTIRSVGDGGSRDAAEKEVRLGPELYRLAAQVGFPKIRAVPPQFFVRTVAGLLKAQFEANQNKGVPDG